MTLVPPYYCGTIAGWATAVNISLYGHGRLLGKAPPQCRREYTRLGNKLKNAQALCKRNAIVGLTEIHASEAVFHSAFCDHIPEVVAKFMEGGGDHAILINSFFAAKHNIDHHILVPGACHAVT